MGAMGEKIRNFFVGLILGISIVLPGLSGSIVAVVFNVYERLMEDIAKIRTKIKEDFWFLMLLGTGVLIGVFLFMFLYDMVPEEYEPFLICFFVGMIMGQLPEVYEMAKDGSPFKKVYILWIAAGILAMVAILIAKGGEDFEIVVDGGLNTFLIMVVVGIVVSVTALMPGMNATVMLMVLGMFTLMKGILTDFDLIGILGLGVGGLFGAIGFAKLMSSFIENHRSVTYYAMIGLTIGSALVILPFDTSDITTIMWYVIYGVIGFAASIALVLWRRKRMGAEINV